MEGFRGDSPDQDVPDAFADGGPRWLTPLALELVAVGEVGEGQVDGQVDGTHQPEAHQLAQYRRAELNQARRVVVCDLGPEPREVSASHVVVVARGVVYVCS